MLSDFETAEALAMFKAQGWPRWTFATGDIGRLRHDGDAWVSEYTEARGQWVWCGVGGIVGIREPIIAEHCRAELDGRWVYVVPNIPGRTGYIVGRRGRTGLTECLCDGGRWGDGTPGMSPAVFPTVHGAYVAGMIASAPKKRRAKR